MAALATLAVLGAVGFVAPAGASTSWSLTNVTSGPLVANTCTSPSSCVALDTNGNILVWNGTTWTATAVGGGLQVVSCVQDYCVVAKNSGSLLQGSLSASPSTWTSTMSDPNGFYGVSCLSSSQCYAVDGNGDIYTGGASGWSPTPNTINGGTATLGIDSISCVPGQDFCMVDDGNGDVAMMTGGVWQAPVSIDPNGGGLYGISCASATFCVTFDNAGDVLAWNGATWTPYQVTPDSGTLNMASCASADFCVVVDANGNAYLWNGSTWTTQDVEGTTYLWTVACAADYCSIGDTNGNVLADAAPLSVSTPTLPAGSVGTSYSAPLSATGGNGLYTWSTSGLPSGLTLDPATGVLSGVPKAGFSGSVDISVSDAGRTSPVTTALPLLVTAQPVVSFTSAPPSDALVGGTYAPGASASSGLPVSFAVDAASTPGSCAEVSGVVAFTGAGDCVIQATSPASGPWLAATATQTVTVYPAPAAPVSSGPSTSPPTVLGPPTFDTAATSPTATSSGTATSGTGSSSTGSSSTGSSGTGSSGSGSSGSGSSSGVAAPKSTPIVPERPVAVLSLARHGSTPPIATVNPAGRLVVPVSCSGSTCHGTVSLSVARRTAHGFVHVVVASGQVSLAKGGAGSAVLSVTHLGQPILLHAAGDTHWRVTATITVGGSVIHVPLLVDLAGGRA